jgi:hypothetical protein
MVKKFRTCRLSDSQIYILGKLQRNMRMVIHETTDVIREMKTLGISEKFSLQEVSNSKNFGMKII